MNRNPARRQEIRPDERPISEEYRIVAEAHADAHAAATMLEHTRKILLFKLMRKHTAHGMAVNKAEVEARCSEEYEDHVDRMVQARNHADRLRVQMEYLKMRHQEWVASDANQRMERKMS